MKRNNTKTPLITIIIPLHVINDRFFSDLKRFARQTHKRTEILVVCDKHVNLPPMANICLIRTKSTITGPAEKRDLAISEAKGEYCAFIDDDAYPDDTWLEKAVADFADKSVVAVGGPGISPIGESYMSNLGGLVYESYLTSGKAQFRFVSKGFPRQYVHDWPAYNLIVRTDILKKVGGYGCTFYGGEDTFLCLKLLEHGNILFDPDVSVYHHRRPLFRSHLKQIFNVGKHRGFFFKKFPKTSRQVFYTIPLLLTVGLVSVAVLPVFLPDWWPVSVALITMPFIAAAGSVAGKTDGIGILLVSLGIILTHIAYGAGFGVGLFTNRMVR